MTDHSDAGVDKMDGDEADDDGRCPGDDVPEEQDHGDANEAKHNYAQDDDAYMRTSPVVMMAMTARSTRPCQQRQSPHSGYFTCTCHADSCTLSLSADCHKSTEPPTCF